MASSAAFFSSLPPSHSLPVGQTRDTSFTVPAKKSRSSTILEDGAVAFTRRATLSSLLPDSVSLSKARRAAAQEQLPTLTTDMTAAPKVGAAKLHKRRSSASSLPSAGPPTPQAGLIPSFATPYATLEEPTLDQKSTTVTSPSSLSAKAKALTYRHRRSSSREDQGQLDLSKPVAENAYLSGLGIQELGAKSASDVDFARSMRRGSHVRTQSGSYTSSQTSVTGPRAAQPFVHPMRLVPRPYTPPLVASHAPSLNDDENDESADVIEENLSTASAFRHKRSMSLSSAPQTAPTPLSQSYTPEAVERRDQSSRLASASQSNLSTHSEQSGRPQPVRPNRPRRDTDLSTDHSTTPSSRTSLDKAFSYVSAKISEDGGSRDDRIRAARRKFEEKEAEKDRKVERSAMKRRETELAKHARHQERQGRKSETSVRARRHSYGVGMASATPAAEYSEKIASTNCDKAQSTTAIAMPSRDRHRGSGSASEKPIPNVKEATVQNPQKHWSRLSEWVNQRINCAR